MRVAAISDVHGNPAALEAVLGEVERERPDAIVFGGDLVSGPFPRETLELLRPLRSAYYVRGNGDRDVAAAMEGGRSRGTGSAWVAQQLTDEDRDFLAAFRDTVVLDVDGLGKTLFCHGSPRSDEEVITHLTPDDRLQEGYEAGRFSYLDITDARRTLNTARVQYLQALSEYHKAVAEIEALVNRPFNGAADFSK